MGIPRNEEGNLNNRLLGTGFRWRFSQPQSPTFGKR